VPQEFGHLRTVKKGNLIKRSALMSDQSSRLNLPYLLPSQAQKHVTHNEALQILDALVQMVIQSFGTDTPPAAPSAGDVHFVGASPTGDWTGQAATCASWDGTGWQFITPGTGWIAWDAGADELVSFDGTSWNAVSGGTQNLDGIGIQASYDSTNRLSLSSPASLFNHAGNGHQIKINKAATGDTASMLFQTNWSGRAEIGTAGNDNLSFKISDDGSTWQDALILNAAAGEVQIDLPITGEAVQQSASDVTAGRLMRADYGYGPGTLLGVVSETGGNPTGAVIERGSNANGDYVRFADGTQICTFEATMTQDGIAKLAYDWTYPIGFVSGAKPVVNMTLIDETSASSGPANFAYCGARFGGGATAHTQATLRLYRRNGGTDFAPADTMDVTVCAIGRWF
jgi:hypothetical protein